MTTESDDPLWGTVRGVGSGDSYGLIINEMGSVSGIRASNIMPRNDGVERYFAQFRTPGLPLNTSAAATSGSALADLESTVRIVANRVSHANPFIVARDILPASFTSTTELPDLIASLSIEKSGDLYKTRMMLKGEHRSIDFTTDSIRSAMLEVASVLIQNKLASDY